MDKEAKWEYAQKDNFDRGNKAQSWNPDNIHFHGQVMGGNNGWYVLIYVLNAGQYLLGEVNQSFDWIMEEVRHCRLVPGWSELVLISLYCLFQENGSICCGLKLA